MIRSGHSFKCQSQRLISVITAITLSSSAHRGVGVFVAIRIGHREYVPVVLLGNSLNASVVGGQQLVQDVGGGGRADPLAGMHSTLDEHSGIVLEGWADWNENRVTRAPSFSLTGFVA